MEFDANKIYQTKLTNSQFEKLSNFIYTNYGIKMPPIKRVMLQSRLHKRLKALKIDNFTQYIKYVFSADGHDEIVHMIDVVSTNKTDFFREEAHFDFIREDLLGKNRYANKSINVWSAGCSSGEEVYTLAMTFEEHILQDPNFNYHILGTDISTLMLDKATKAIYKAETIDVIPKHLKRKYFLKSKQQVKQTVRVIQKIRNKASYKRINLIKQNYFLPSKFDIIFCRNVLIYFDRGTQEKVITKLLTFLKPNGYLFLGHSESLTGFNFNLKQIKTTVFQKK